MANLKNYYIPFLPLADINYYYLFSLYDLAQYRKEQNSYDYLKIKSYNALANEIDISESTARRMLTEYEDYKNFFNYNKETKEIILLNKFARSANNNKPFVVLKDTEIEFLRKHKEKLFPKYLIYLKYSCGHSKSKQATFTIPQFLEATGYANTKAYADKVSSFNTLLVCNGVIKINRFLDKNIGQYRNSYIYLIP